MQAATIDDLRHVNALIGVPDEHLQWILDHSEYQEFEDGSLISKYGDPAEKMFIIIHGKADFYMQMNGRQVYYFTFENNGVTGGVGGLMPYSRMKSFPGSAYASDKLRLVRLHKDHFHELEQLNPELIQRLIGYMTERARAFATTQLQHEKVNALGKLAAGIAHEMNNPAAAINSISSELKKRLRLNYELTEKLLHCAIRPKQIQDMEHLIRNKENEPASIARPTVIRRMELEDDMAAWLEKGGIPNDREMAEALTDLGFSPADLESICNGIEADSLVHVLRWLENLLSSQKLMKDLDEASSRISNLVGAIKSHVHMDRTDDLQPTDLHLDIENTLTLMGYKLREKNIRVEKVFSENLPLVPAYIGELNQVWTNLIDNAIYAMPQNGSLVIQTSSDDRWVKVSIRDNGSGIPKEIISRIFDPFFTTKKVGEGTGIGLDMVNRVMKHHSGEIKVTSVPGDTEFTICIPLTRARQEDR